MTARRYRHSGDRISDRIISEFDDFGGWTDDSPPIRGDVADDEEFGSKGTRRAARKEKPIERRESSGGKTPDQPIEIQTEALAVCPSCKCSLPDPDHLVSSAMLFSGELSRARDTRTGAA